MLTKRIGDVSSELTTALDAISEIDSFFAKAKYSIDIIGAFPGLEIEKSFKLLDARHPILLKELKVSVKIE